MATYTVEFTPRAWRDLDALLPDVADRITLRTEELQERPQPRGDTIKRLQGIETPTYRFRIGDYRALFQIEGTVVQIFRVIHRSEFDRAVRELI